MATIATIELTARSGAVLTYPERIEGHYLYIRTATRIVCRCGWASSGVAADEAFAIHMGAE